MDSEARTGRGAIEEEPTLRDYIDVLMRRWWAVALAVVVAVSAALGGSLLAPRVYRAQATLVVDRGGASLGLIPDITGFAQQTYVDTLAEIVKSRTVAERALTRMGVTEADRDKALKRLETGLKVMRVRGADMIRIQAEGRTPEAAAQTANAVAESFLAWQLEARRGQASAGRQFIDGQIASVGIELRSAEESLSRHKILEGQVALSAQTIIAINKLAEFEAQRRTASAERQSIEASLRQARSSLEQQQATVPSAFVTAEDPVVAQLRADLARLEVEQAGLREQYTNRHPRVEAVRARIEEVKESLRQHTARHLASQTATLNPLHQELAGQVIKMEVERQALQAREGALAATVSRYAREVQSLPPKEVVLARLTRDLKVAEETYLLLSQKLHEAKIAEASIVGDVRIVDRALPPKTPVRPRPALNMLLGALLGMMLGVGAVYLLESLDTTFRTPDEVGQTLGLPVLAAVPFWLENGRRRGTNGANLPMLMHLHPRSPFAEAIRHLRTNLLYLSPDKPLRSILVTSPESGVGKSTIAANLAIALTQTGQRVWLVESDLRRPGLTSAFQPESGSGLTELLVDGLPIERALQATEIEGLRFLPGGAHPPNPAELLGSQKMRSFLESGRGQTDSLILDSPPVLPVTDAMVLAPAVDGVLLVVNLQNTPREAARRARGALDSVGARLLGVVVTGMPGRRGKGYYGYYSHYYASGGGAPVGYAEKTERQNQGAPQR